MTLSDNIFSVQDKIIIVFGATGNFGSSIAKHLAKSGAKLILVARNQINLENLFREISQYNNNCEIYPLDIRNEPDCEEFSQYLSTKYDYIDGVIFNAYSGSGGDISQITSQDIKESLDVNIKSPLLLTQMLLPLLKSSQDASIINIASIYGMVSPDPRIYGDDMANNPAYYGAGKAGLIQTTKYLACELADHKIRVNSVSPGAFPSEEVTKNHPEFHQKLINKIPLSRTGKAEDLSGVIQFLLSGSSSYITGSNIVIDGGWTAW